MTAFKDLWIIGNDFVNKIFHALPALQTENCLAKQQELYIYEQFNVKCFTGNPLSSVRNIGTRLVNAYIKALNDYNKLPRFVLVIPNNDVSNSFRLKKDCHEFRVLTQSLLQWILTTMAHATQSKKDMLLSRKPGVVTASEPKMIWVSDLNRNNDTKMEHFNKILNTELLNKKQHYLINVDKFLTVQDSWFSGAGINCLNSAGRVAFWSELDRIIKKFDFKDISLKALEETDHHQQKQQQCMKMPPPLPECRGHRRS